MGIQIILVSGEIGDVTGDTLDQLIRKNEVAAFRRSERWVQISCDTIRRQQTSMRSGNRQGDLTS
jgi:CBS-domain-containing membrane protein